MLRFCLRLDEITYKEYAHSPNLAEPRLYPILRLQHPKEFGNSSGTPTEAPLLPRIG